MTVTYCTVEDVSDFLRIPITATTTPNKTQVEKIINRKEEEFERRTGHAWRVKTITREVHSLPLLYTFGWGTPIFLRHRRILDLDNDQGDKVEIWQGASATWENIVTNGQWFDVEYERGSLHLRGFLFSILRRNRCRVTYRYGGENFAGDTTIPLDIKDCIIKMAAIDIMNTSFRMDEIPSGGTTSPSESKKYWQEDIENCIANRREVVVVGI